MPKIFIFNGCPNAFVFGYPVSLAISNKLISCLSKSELQMVLRHELAHIKNRDFILKPFLQTMRILFFYNPVVHFLYYKMINERELLADSLFLNFKTDKITFMEAIVKIHGSTNYHKLLPKSIIGSCSLSLFTHNIKKLEIKDRFNHLFYKKVKKTFYSTLVCMIILLSNISIIAIAQNNILSNSLDFCEEPETEKIEVNCEMVSSNRNISSIYVFRIFRENLQLSEGFVIRDLILDVPC
jgi:beta-lactamase regulating signal transducer with metallopeptidase domain